MTVNATDPPAGGSPLARHWALDPAIDFLNHGSFGACPPAVLAVQRALQDELEREPVRFFVRRLEGLFDEVRQCLGGLVHAAPEDLVFVPNATYAVNSVLASLRFTPGAELLVTDHEYNACRNVLDLAAERSGARVVVARVPFPIRSADEVVAAVLGAVGPRTELALIDHITSPTGLVLPVARLVAALQARGVDCLVDGAHAVGQVDLDLPALGAAYYTSNCHKWLCAPKGAAFLWVRPDRQARIHPACTSHGRNAPPGARSRYLVEFDWTGTADPTPYLCIPAALRFCETLVPGGLPALRARNHALALAGRERLCAALGIAPPAPADMLAAMAAVPLPPGRPEPPASALYNDPLQDALFARGLEVPVIPWPAPPHRLLRISAQAYNGPAQYERLARVLQEVL